MSLTLDSKTTLEWFLSHCAIRHYAAKHCVSKSHAQQNRLYYLLKGCATLFVKNPEGKEMILASLERGDFMGEAGLFQLSPQPNTWIRTKTPCDIAEISYSRFLQLVPVNPAIMMGLTKQLVHRWHSTAQRLSNHLFLGVTERILHSLLLLAVQPEAMTHPSGIQIKSTRQEIGQLAGCSRETVGRTLKLLAAQNVLSARGKTIVLHHQNAA